MTAARVTRMRELVANKRQVYYRICDKSAAKRRKENETPTGMKIALVDCKAVTSISERMVVTWVKL
jgi:hypothetical protein